MTAIEHYCACGELLDQVKKHGRWRCPRCHAVYGLVCVLASVDGAVEVGRRARTTVREVRRDS